MTTDEGMLIDALAAPVNFEKEADQRYSNIEWLQKRASELMADYGYLDAETVRAEYGASSMPDVSDIAIASICERIPKSRFMDWVSRLYDNLAEDFSQKAPGD